MLSLEELKEISEMPLEDEVSLKTITEFYEKYISNRIYELELEDETILHFQIENRHLPHLLALNKFLDRKKSHNNFRLNSSKQLTKDIGFNNLKNGHIKIEDLKTVNGTTKKYKDYKKRILYFPFTYQLLRKSVFVSYDILLAERKTTIKGNYLFANDVGKNKLHFFFINDSYDHHVETTTVPITFIEENINDFTYTSKQTKLKINKIIIKDITTRETLEEYNFVECSESIIRKEGQDILLDSIQPKAIENVGQVVEDKTGILKD
ncbi:MAG: hypothetical protein JJE21_02195 [Spirochaetaceae bacterium]|nr:hypothetical protein [Spirochaetaceae bacterium]